ncbi:MAG: carbon storage regulator [Pirellulales bacterium]
MLILSRKLNETVYVGNDVVIRVVKIKGNVVGLGIEAPNNVRILRSEIAQSEKQLAEAKPKAKQAKGPLGNFTIAG